MKVKELIETLQDFPEDTEVRLAIQPNWPFEHSIQDVVYVTDGEDDRNETGTVYIAEGRQLGYLPGNVTDELCWGR